MRFLVAGAATFGHGDYESAVRAEITSLGLHPAVKLIGFVADTAQWLDSLHVLVHPATVPEPYGQSVCEAMGRGVPVIATDAGGTSELLRNSGTGSFRDGPLRPNPSHPFLIGWPP